MKKTTILLAVFCVLSSGLSAQALYPVSLAEKSSNASLIIEGKVISAHSFWDDKHTMILTSNTVQPTKVFKGTADGSPVEILTIGGAVDDFVMTASELLTLSPGSTGIFFCFPQRSGLRSPLTGRRLLDVYGSSQGFILYNLATQRASTQFAHYDNITADLYPVLSNATGRSVINLDPSFDVRAFKAPVALKGDAPVITGFSPATVIAGKFSDPANNNLIITGSGFGTATAPARIDFDDADDGTGNNMVSVSATSDQVVSWTDLQIIVRVPGKAGTGTFRVYDAAGVSGISPTTLNVAYAVLTSAVAQAPTERMYSLMKRNATGGYTYSYSISSDNSGANFATSPEEAPFNRAMTTWKEMVGVNFTYGGPDATQTIDVYDNINIVMLDNTANGAGNVLPAGVLAVCYSGGNLCPGANAYVMRSGFDIVIRRAGVSMGTTAFNNSSCKTAIGFTQTDMESVLLHELGHALNLGHINDSYIGTGLPYIDPQKVMNFAIVNGVDRRSPDWSAFSGAKYNVNPRGLTYCGGLVEMTPLPSVTVEAKDECPLVFPSMPTPTNTQATFDLNHATSNKNRDPQATRVLPSGNITAITNNAWFAIRTNNSGGTLSITVSGYSTVPVAQAACTGAGVELALYQTASCPAGQSFQAPVAYRTFGADSTLTAISGLVPNTSYLIMADGLSNTRAVFTLTMGGTALPVRFVDFTGVKSGQTVVLDWTTGSETNNDHYEVETSKDGSAFYMIGSEASKGDNDTEQSYSFTDHSPASGENYYRLKQVDKDGHSTYSKTIIVEFSAKASIQLFPNPVTDELRLLLPKPVSSLVVSIYSMNGALMQRNSVQFVTRQYNLDLASFAAGVYIVEIRADNEIQQARFIRH